MLEIYTGRETRGGRGAAYNTHTVEEVFRVLLFYIYIYIGILLLNTLNEVDVVQFIWIFIECLFLYSYFQDWMCLLGFLCRILDMYQVCVLQCLCPLKLGFNFSICWSLSQFITNLHLHLCKENFLRPQLW